MYYLYAAGFEDEAGDFGMFAGPTPNLESVKSMVLAEQSINIVIFRAKVGEMEPYLRPDGEGEWFRIEQER